jgi:hypothetical protein
MCDLDHITVAAATLEEGAAYIATALGVQPGPGGAHARMGTHNLLLRLGPALFLEVIAPDPSNAHSERSWFALRDPALLQKLREDGPRLVTWVVRTDDIRVGERSPIALGAPTRVARGDLEWSITVPADGSMPADGAMPTLIQWPEGPHPATRMVDRGVTLQSLHVRSPHDVAAACAAIGFTDPRVHYEIASEMTLTAVLLTPQGVVHLA